LKKAFHCLTRQLRPLPSNYPSLKRNTFASSQ